MPTAIELFNTIEDKEVRARAIANCGKFDNENKIYKDVAEAILHGFGWGADNDYDWHGIYISLTATTGTKTTQP